jgi:hypothetical protein
MTDQEFEQEKQRLEQLFAFWQPLIVSPDWEVSYEWERNPSPVDTAGWQDTMSCAAKWTHLKARIYVNVPACSNNEHHQAFTDADVIHELLHIPTNEVRECLTDDQLGHDERVVSALAQAIVRVFEAGRQAAKANHNKPGLSVQEYARAKEEMRRIKSQETEQAKEPAKEQSSVDRLAELRRLLAEKLVDSTETKLPEGAQVLTDDKQMQFIDALLDGKMH